MTKHISGTTYGEIDEDFIYLTKRVRIPRGDILTARPKRKSEGSIIVTRSGSIRVCEKYESIVYALYGAVIPAGGEHDTKPASRLSDLAKTLCQNDDTAEQILNALRREKGIFYGTATELVQKISLGVDCDTSRRFINANCVGRALSRNFAIFEKLFVMHKPRLRSGRTYYSFDGLQPGVEL